MSKESKVRRKKALSNKDIEFEETKMKITDEIKEEFGRMFFLNHHLDKITFFYFYNELYVFYSDGITIDETGITNLNRIITSSIDKFPFLSMDEFFTSLNENLMKEGISLAHYSRDFCFNKCREYTFTMNLESNLKTV